MTRVPLVHTAGLWSLSSGKFKMQDLQGQRYCVLWFKSSFRVPFIFLRHFYVFMMGIPWQVQVYCGP